MLKSHNKAIILDKNGKNNASFEVNWNGNAEGLVKIIIDDKEATLELKHLYSFIFVACDPEQQDNLIPVRKTTITKYTRQHKIVAKKDIKKGEFLVANCEINVPTVVEEGLKGFLKLRKSRILRA